MTWISLVQANLHLVCNTLSQYITCNLNNRIEGVLSPRFLEVSVLTSKQGIEDPKQLATKQPINQALQPLIELVQASI